MPTSGKKKVQLFYRAIHSKPHQIIIINHTVCISLEINHKRIFTEHAETTMSSAALLFWISVTCLDHVCRVACKIFNRVTAVGLSSTRFHFCAS